MDELDHYIASQDQALSAQDAEDGRNAPAGNDGIKAELPSEEDNDDAEAYAEEDDDSSDIIEEKSDKRKKRPALLAKHTKETEKKIRERQYESQNLEKMENMILHNNLKSTNTSVVDYKRGQELDKLYEQYASATKESDNIDIDIWKEGLDEVLNQKVYPHSNEVSRYSFQLLMLYHCSSISLKASSRRNKKTTKRQKATTSKPPDIRESSRYISPPNSRLS